MIPISVVEFGPEVEERVLAVLRSGIIAQGPVVAELESKFAELQDVKHAIAVNNGTTALVAAIQALDLQPGDEVVTSPFTFIATLNAILEAGATVRFGEVSPSDFGLDPASVEAQITDRTKVILPVHLYGQAVDLDPLVALATKHNLTIIEDAAQAPGARYKGRGVGSFGIGCFSLYATKNITSGEGGMITTNDDEIAAKLRIMRNQGMRARYEYVMAGHNYRLTDLQAAVAVPQLESYASQLASRRSNAARLIELLGDIPGLVLPSELPGREHVWHQFTVLLPNDLPIGRDTVVARLAEEGVGAGVYYPRAVYDYEIYRSRPDVIHGNTPVADNVAARCLSLPVHQKLSSDDLVTIAEALRKVLGA